MRKIYIEWDTVEELVIELCRYIQNKNPDIKYVCGLPRGGLIPAVLVSHRMGIPYISDPTLHDSKNVMIVDDICDSGNTLKTYSEYPTAVLHYKPHTSCYKPDVWATKHTSDDWIIYPWERDDSLPIQDYLLDN